MKIYLFSQADFLKQTKIDENEIISILHRVAEGTDTADLVVSVYFIPRTSWVGGTAYVKKWYQRDFFATARGKWKFSKLFRPPTDLPGQYKLIRLLPTNEKNYYQYPTKLRDGYDWVFSYSHFRDHLALLFAHELHHFRRFHLNLHAREGENSANRWALEHVQKLGFSVTGQLFRVKKKLSFFKKKSFKNKIHDPFSEFRGLAKGRRIYIKYDPKGLYEGSYATVLRPIRSTSRRMAIQTSDSREWLWPMEWLLPIEKNGKKLI